MTQKIIKYCNNLCNYSRIQTSEVMVGNVGVGGINPIRIQSMTTTDTLDTDSSVKQSIKMIKAGCELVRLTAPSIKDARNLFEIKNQLIKKGIGAPVEKPFIGTLVDVFAAQVRADPAATVVISGESSLSYADLDRRSS